MKSKFFTSIAFALYLVAAMAAPEAHAQFVVSTPDADAELTTANVSLGTQAVAAVKTAATTADMLGVAKDTFSAIGSGVTIFGNQAFQSDDSLGGDAKTALNLMNGGSSGAGGIAQTIRSASSSLDKSFFSKVNPFAKNTLSNDMDSAASSMAANEDIYTHAAAHTAELEKLRLQVTTTVSLKEAADLNARIQLETADITNEMVKVQALQNMEGHNDKVREVQTKQQLFGRNSKTY